MQYYDSARFPNERPKDEEQDAFEWAAFDDFASRAEVRGENGEAFDDGPRSARRAAARSPREGGESPPAKRRR